MTWLLMWLNVSVATLNAMLQLLVIYRLYNFFLRLIQPFTQIKNNNLRPLLLANRMNCILKIQNINNQFVLKKKKTIDSSCGVDVSHQLPINPFFTLFKAVYTLISLIFPISISTNFFNISSNLFNLYCLSIFL